MRIRATPPERADAILPAILIRRTPAPGSRARARRARVTCLPRVQASLFSAGCTPPRVAIPRAERDAGAKRDVCRVFDDSDDYMF